MREPGASQASRGNQRHRKVILNGGWLTMINKTIYMYPQGHQHLDSEKIGVCPNGMAAHKILMSISSTQASYPMYAGSEGEERWPGYEAIQVHEIT